MKAHILQHVPFEGIGSIQSWLTAQNASVNYTRFFESSELPRFDDFDLLIVMGGPMSVNDGDSFPWLKKEKRFILEAIQAGKYVVGICLGAQLIVSAMGAPVYQCSDKEIGWFNVEAASSVADLFQFPKALNVFHWHGETFDLPTNATCLAKNSVCKNQAFQIAKNVIGMQFHLESTPETVDLIIQNCRDELIGGMYIQSEQSMRITPKTNYTLINQLMSDVLSYITNGYS